MPLGVVPHSATLACILEISERVTVFRLAEWCFPNHTISVSLMRLLNKIIINIVQSGWDSWIWLSIQFDVLIFGFSLLIMISDQQNFDMVWIWISWPLYWVSRKHFAENCKCTSSDSSKLKTLLCFLPMASSVINWHILCWKPTICENGIPQLEF